VGYPKFDIPRPAVILQVTNWQNNQTKDHKENYAKMED
jgi:hypothetical protein